MSATPLNQKLLAAGALTGMYSGVETPSRFSDVTVEFRALTTTCAVYDLGWRAKIIVTGKDRHRWLNGMVTNNIKDLQLNYGNYSFLLNPQGRIQGDLYAFNRGDYLIIDTDHSQLAPLTKALQRYIIMDDVHLTDASDKIAAIGVGGPTTGEVLLRAGIDISGLERMQLIDGVWNDIGISIVHTGNNDFATWELWAAIE